MRHAILFAGVFVLVLVLAGSPAQAFTAKTLAISVQGNGNAVIDFSYELTWYETVVVYSRIIDPATEIQNAVRGQFGKDVTVTSVSDDHVQLFVQDFASRTVNSGMVSLKTPAMSFRSAQTSLNKYWFAPFVTPDFSPQVTTLTFPDGYTQEFYSQDHLPSVTHAMSAP